MITRLGASDDPLALDYAKAEARAEAAARVARRSGNYPLLSGGDVDLYSLFVERSMTLMKRDGLVGLLTPSGIASDLTAARFFKGVLYVRMPCRRRGGLVFQTDFVTKASRGELARLLLISGLCHVPDG